MALSGPRLDPPGKADSLVVLCHGYGADGNDLIALAEAWRKVLPETAFVAPHAPERCPGAGYQWFPITRLEPLQMRQGVERAAPVLEAFLAAELAARDLAPERLALVGFSQGAMLALHVGLRLKPAAIVGLSGLLATPVPQGPHPTPVLLGHGDRDTMIPPEALFASAVTLGLSGVAVEWHLRPGLPHGIDETEIAIAGRFIASAFAGRLSMRGEVSCPVR
jgi:phospholipase/carboxylesterase